MEVFMVTYDVSWNTYTIHKSVLKTIFILALVFSIVASCQNSNDYNTHSRTADQAERTLR